MVTRADRKEVPATRQDRVKFPGVSQPGRTTLKGISLSTRVDQSKSLRELATKTQDALDELESKVSRRLNELSVYLDQTGEQKRDVGRT